MFYSKPVDPLPVSTRVVLFLFSLLQLLHVNFTVKTLLAKRVLDAPRIAIGSMDLLFIALELSVLDKFASSFFSFSWALQAYSPGSIIDI